jgi:RNA polymerase-binding transcription factor DksA
MLSALRHPYQKPKMERQEHAMNESPSSTQKKVCNLCGQPIAPARLEALPGVTTCINCAKKHPRKVDVSGVELSQASPINRNGFAPSD